MTISPGARLGFYEITAALGAGGMGEVFRARDTKLNRDVAIKVLPAAFADDPERLARFTREAQTLASLNHPNIATIYGIEEVPAVSGSTGPGSRALVMELVEGEDLSIHIARGPIPIAEALPIARQIAEALEAAHENAIVHRDLKPANIKVRTDGTVKVLDFGLAKAMDPAGTSSSNPNVSHSPTLTHQGTMAGMIIGTAAYMSPEQAKGKAVDKRADIWAFGVVLYEMLTGTRCFQGEDVSETLAAVLRQEINLKALPTDTPPRLARLIARCLDRDLKTRLRDIGEARVKLARIETGGPDSAASAPASAAETSARARLPWTLVAVLTIALVAALVAWAPWRAVPAPPETRVDIVTPVTDQPAAFALSPDGSQIVFVASGDGASRLWLRSLAATAAQPLSGTEGAIRPFWSPDGRSIGFFAGDSLKRLDLGGGAPQILAPVTGGWGGTWSPDGIILFAPTAVQTALMRVAATGGAAVAVTTLAPGQQSHAMPSFLPDGRRFLFSALGAPDTAGIYLGTLDGSAPVRLTPVNGPGLYLPSGWLLWLRTNSGTLVAQRLDLEKAALTGAPQTLADGVIGDTSGGAISVAATGLVAYRAGANQKQLIWLDRSGTVRGAVSDPDSSLGDPRVSPDGRRIAVERSVQGNKDIWLLDGARTSRFTSDAAFEWCPVWSPDGAHLVFRSNRTGPMDLYQKLSSGAGAEERFVASDSLKTPSSWSTDGRFLLYGSQDSQTNTDIWVVPMVGDHTPSVFLKTPFREVWGAFSPDSRWVAYMSNESGRMEIYIRPFVPPGASSPTAPAAGTPVSTAGGIMPLWRPDGKELYFLNPSGAMMAASITVTGSTLEPGTPVMLFPTHIYGGGTDTQQNRQYDVAPDGRFLINTVLSSANAPITLLQNWSPKK